MIFCLELCFFDSLRTTLRSTALEASDGPSFLLLDDGRRCERESLSLIAVDGEWFSVIAPSDDAFSIPLPALD